MNSTNLAFIILLLYFIKSTKNQIIFPFEEFTYSNNPERIYKDIESFYFDQYKTNIYTILNIGEPAQSLLTFILSEDCIFQIYNESICYSKSMYNYNLAISQTFKNITQINGKYFYFQTSLINETINFCVNEECTNKKKMDNFQINLFNGIENSKILCSQMGLTITTSEENKWIRNINQFKEHNIINGLRYTVIYTSDHNGYIYVGQFPHEYNSTNFFLEQKREAYIDIKVLSSYLLPSLEMDEIFFNYNDSKIQMKEKNAIFYMDYGLILGTKNYLEKIEEIFFSKYYKDEICTEYNFFIPGKHFIGIKCKILDEFKIKEFPNLYLFNRELNYTFELNYKDLFKKNNDEYYFLIIFDQMIINIWKIGKPFLRKYQLTFDIDSKSIIFYDQSIKPSKQNINNNSDNKVLIIVLISIGGLIIICGLIIGAYYLGKQINASRKKRANELSDDDYEYFSKNDNNNDNKNEGKGLFNEGN